MYKSGVVEISLQHVKRDRLIALGLLKKKKCIRRRRRGRGRGRGGGKGEGEEEEEEGERKTRAGKRGRGGGGGGGGQINILYFTHCVHVNIKFCLSIFLSC